MPTVTLNLDELVRRGVEKTRVAHLIDRLGLSVEKIEGSEITVEVTPNRPDLLEVNGMARALKLLEGKTIPKENQYEASEKPILKITVGRGVKKTRPFIAGLVAKGASLTSSSIKELMNFQEKLHDTYGRRRRKMAIGIHDFDKVEGDLTYDAEKTGKMTPLGGKGRLDFDAVMKFAANKEADEIIRAYNTYPHLHDKSKTIALIPVLNCEETKISEQAKNLFVEVTGTSQQTVNDTLNMIACLLQDAGAKIYSCEIVNGKSVAITPTLEYRELKIPLKSIEKTIGFEARGNDGIVLANRMGYVAAKYGTGSVLFLIPPYRTDILDERDVIEDIGIAFGYDKIRPIPVFGSSVATPDEFTEYANTISIAMVGLGYSEAMSTYLTNERQCFDMVRRKYEPAGVVSVTYSKTETLSILRSSVLPSLLGSLSASLQATMPQRLFELGSVFTVAGSKVKEERHIAIVSEHARSNLSEIKSAISSLLESAGIKDFDIKEDLDGAFISGRCASISVKGQKVGIFGEIHPEVLSNFKIEEPVAAAEIDLTKLLVGK